MGNKIDTSFVTKDQLQYMREWVQQEIEKNGKLSDNMLILMKNLNSHITFRLVAKWIIILLLSLLSVTGVVENITEYIFNLIF